MAGAYAGWRIATSVGALPSQTERMTTCRIYSETLPYADVVRRRTVDLLARYRLELVLAVRPWDLPALSDVARTLRDSGIRLSVWPMLADEQGRWASVHNAEAFADLTMRVCDALESADASPRDVLFDLEPPFAHARALTNLGAAGKKGLHRIAQFARDVGAPAPPRADRHSASAALTRLVADVHARGIDTSMAVWPLVALDPPDARAWQSLLGTPVDGLGAGHVSVMLYTSIFEGWSRGVLGRGHTTALLAAATVRTVRRWGAQAGVSLGCVGTGAFEDEPTYRDPSEVAVDAAIARAAGCDRLTLFDLGGVLAREPAEAWLEAFVAGDTRRAAERPHASSKRIAAARAVAHAATWALARAF